MFYERLLEYFTSDDIVRQKRVTGSRQPIDFYVKSIDTYVQFDGVYWHELDRPIEVIEKRKTKHDEEIAVRWYKDIEQSKWFLDKGFRLVRVTDVEFSSLQFDVIMERILK